jgi:hypothetical protein
VGTGRRGCGAGGGGGCRRRVHIGRVALGAGVLPQDVVEARKAQLAGLRVLTHDTFSHGAGRGKQLRLATGGGR